MAQGGVRPHGAEKLWTLDPNWRQGNWGKGDLQYDSSITSIVVGRRNAVNERQRWVLNGPNNRSLKDDRVAF